MTDDSEVPNLTVRVLQGIRRDLRDLRQDFQGLRSDVGELRQDFQGLRGDLNELRGDVNARFDGLERATVAGFEGVHHRLEAIRDIAGDHWRDHEDRIRRLEAHARLG